MKECSHCKKLKPLENFYKAKGGVGGRRGDCKTCVRLKAKAYHQEHTEQARVTSSKYYKIHGDRLRRYQVEYSRNRYANDSTYRLMCSLRNRLRQALKGNDKSETTKNLLGCSVDRLRSYIQSKFTEGMHMGNYGDWHLDHVQPCASFDLSDAKQQRACFHYTNLQPLWAKDNLIKSSKVTQG